MSGIIAKYKKFLPLPPTAPCLTLGEGNTPLIPLQNTDLPKGIEVFVKVEGANPTASFKDRGMVVAVAAAVAAKARCVICASTGNTSASAAAYSARVKLPCIVLIPAGKVATGKIAQAVIHGAEIVQISGSFDDAMAAVKMYSSSGEAAVVNSINPMRLQGQKTAAFEIIDELGDAPDYHALPVGNAGNITAHWIGYCEATGSGTAACLLCGGNCLYHVSPALTAKRPTMLGYQAENSAPFIHGTPVKNPDTVATAIRIGNPQSYDAANIVLKESGGRIGAISDAQILATQKHLAIREGVFCEPASAASVAGVLADIAAAKIQAPARIVCTLTGHGLKDPDVVGAPDVHVCNADSDSMQKAIDNIINRYADV
ncbi:MAG: threonine synthase [Gammaproteobacteria bacterium WSBS_2016_MAG_OTU1]